MVASDHGFGPCLGRIHVNKILVDAGIAALPNFAGNVRRRVKQARESLRLWNVKRHDPTARSSSFDTSVSAQFALDWKRTLAFAPHQDTAAMLYMNTVNRRKEAPLRTPREIDEARTAAVAALKAARHPETGVALFPKIVETALAYNVDPAREGYPDIIALPEENHWVRTKLSASPNWVEADANLPGTHRPEGIIALAGAGIASGRHMQARLIDVAPTVLKLFGIPIPSHMEGVPFEVVGGSQSKRVDPPAAAIAGPHQPDFDYSPEEQAIIEQRLADLGYLE